MGPFPLPLRSSFRFLLELFLLVPRDPPSESVVCVSSDEEDVSSELEDVSSEEEEEEDEEDEDGGEESEEEGGCLPMPLLPPRFSSPFPPLFGGGWGVCGGWGRLSRLCLPCSLLLCLSLPLDLLDVLLEGLCG